MIEVEGLQAKIVVSELVTRRVGFKIHQFCHNLLHQSLSQDWGPNSFILWWWILPACGGHHHKEKEFPSLGRCRGL